MITATQCVTKTVVFDANLKRVWTLGNDAATGETPSMQDIAEKGKMFFYLDREVGEVLDAEGLDALLADSKGIEEEKARDSWQLGMQLDVLERAAKITGVSFMTMGLLFYVMGNWSAQNAIHRAAQSYTPSQPREGKGKSGRSKGERGSRREDDHEAKGKGRAKGKHKKEEGRESNSGEEEAEDCHDQS
eukprot:s100_g29.t1